MQSHMFGILARVHRAPGEEAIQWFKSRNAADGNMVELTGIWEPCVAEAFLDGEDRALRSWEYGPFLFDLRK